MIKIQLRYRKIEVRNGQIHLEGCILKVEPTRQIKIDG